MKCAPRSWVMPVIALSLGVAVALAQRKPDALAHASPPKRDFVLAPEFLTAYRMAGSPSLMIATYVDSSPSDTWEAAKVARNYHARLKHDFHHPAVDVKSVAPDEIARDRKVNTQILRDQFAAAVMLSNKTPADYALVTVLTKDRSTGGFAGVYEISDLGRGRSIATWPWDMERDANGSFSTMHLNRYADGQARRMSRDLIKWWTYGGDTDTRRPYVLRFVGVGLADSGQVEKAIESVPQTRLIKSDFDSGGRSGLFSATVAYAGAPIALARALRSSCAMHMEKEVTCLGAREGVIDFQVTGRRLTIDETLLTGDLPPASLEARWKELKDRLSTAYRQQGSPKLVVMIHREAKRADDGAAPPHAEAPRNGVGSNSVHVYLGDRLGGAPPTDVDPHGRASADAPDTRHMETRVIARLQRLGFHVKTLDGVWAQLLRDGSLAGKSWTGTELAKVISARSGAGIVVSGTGTIIHRRITVPADTINDSAAIRQNDRTLRFDLRAFDRNSQIILATATVERRVPVFDELEEGMDDLAAEAVGQLAHGLLAHWTAQP